MNNSVLENMSNGSRMGVEWKLNEVLLKKKISKYELAKKTGLSKPTIYNLQKQKDLNLSTVILICRILNVQLNDILVIKD